jgi:O-antigen/teichoic acid export membrane protein
MFVRNVFYTFSTEIVSVVSNLVIGVILARILTPTERGIMVLVMTFPWMVVSFADLGFSQANIYLLGRKKRDPRLILGSSLLVSVGIGLLLVIAAQPVKDLALRTVLKGLPAKYWWQLMLLIPTSLADTMLLSILRARQRFDLFNLRRLVTPILLVLGIGVGFALGGRLDVAVGVYVGTTALMALLSLALTSRVVPLALAFDRSIVQESLRFGLKSYMQNMVGRVNYRLDVYMLALFLSPDQVAFYGVATSIAEVAWYAPNSVGMVLFPRLSSIPEEEAHQITAKVCRNTLALTGLIIGGLLLVSWLFVPLIYGAPYRASIPPLLILLPGVMSMAVYKVLTRNFTSRDRQQISILASVLALVSNVGLDWLLIPVWGVAGAAVASTAGYTAAGLILLVFFVRESSISWQRALLPDLGELAGHWRWLRATLQDRIVQARGQKGVM